MSDVRTYGKEPYGVAVLHGGPGAPGYLKPVATQLAKKFGVIEPLQSALNVAGEVEQLFKQLLPYNAPFVLIGHSWGAWLAMAFAHQYPKLVKHLILIGCPPLEERYASDIMPNRLKNLKPDDAHTAKWLLDRMQAGKLTDDELEDLGDLMEEADAYERRSDAHPPVKPNADIFESVWKEASEMRKKGEWVDIAKQIKAHMTFIHGMQDPHPYKGVQDVLNKAGVDVEFVLMDRCGHNPWQEKYRRSAFYKMLDIYIKEF